MVYPRLLNHRSRRIILAALIGLAFCSVLFGIFVPSVNQVVRSQEPAGSPPTQDAPLFVTNNYKQTNLVSDLPGFAQIQDPLLVNPWGITQSATSPFWVANNVSSTSTLYVGDV